MKTKIKLLLIVTLVLTALMGTAAHSFGAPEQLPYGVPAARQDDDWLEPRGLNILDLVGEIPEHYLKDAIVSFVGGAGISQYHSGIRHGSQVTITYRVTPNYQSVVGPITLVSCPSYQGFSDHWPVPMPKAYARYFADGQDITNAIFAIKYHPSGLIKPSTGATSDRYPTITAPSLEFNDEGAIWVPANMGCTIFLQGTHTDMRATYVYEHPQQVSVRLLGLDAFDFQSYIGPGEAGLLKSLQVQMSAFGNRHDKFALTPPVGTDYIFVHYPPTPVGAYVAGDVDKNVRLPSSGTYRLASGIVKLSTDHYVSFGMPLQGQWLDADLGGFLYLGRLTNVNMLAAPEYFVPAGVEYDSCMQHGGCPTELLNRIYNATMRLSVYYLAIDRINPNLLRYPLRMVGPGWEEETIRSTSRLGHEDIAPLTMEPPSHQVYLPIIEWRSGQMQDDPTGCPCGWFDQGGRMYDFTPRLEETIGQG